MAASSERPSDTAAGRPRREYRTRGKSAEALVTVAVPAEFSLSWPTGSIWSGAKPSSPAARKALAAAIVDRQLQSGAERRDLGPRRRAGRAAPPANSKQSARRSASRVDVDERSRTIERARDATVKALGRIDILVNNAGIAGANAHDLGVSAGGNGRKVMRINLDGQFYCCRARRAADDRAELGRIVNIASIAGKEGNPNAAAYSASKAGVIALTKSLGKELARLRHAVNCITPAAAKTAIFDQMTQAAHRSCCRRFRAAASSRSRRSRRWSRSARRPMLVSPRCRLSAAAQTDVYRSGDDIANDVRAASPFAPSSRVTRWMRYLSSRWKPIPVSPRTTQRASPPAADRHRADVRRGHSLRLPRCHREISRTHMDTAAGGLRALYRRVPARADVLQSGQPRRG